jgi:molybdopterin-guanine dinucleotide biosynthesis protein A
MPNAVTPRERRSDTKRSPLSGFSDARLVPSSMAEIIAGHDRPRGVAVVPPDYDRRVSRAAAIILAGGRSSRMGASKATLDWHGSTLVRRVSGIAARSVDGPVIVVRAPAQALPELGAGVEVAADAREGRGPMQGLAAGLAAVGDRASVAYVASTDVPLLHPAFVRRVVEALTDGFDVALPESDDHRQPLAAAYRPSLLPLVEELIAADFRGTAPLFARCRVRHLDERALLRDAVLARCDPELASLTNLNTPADYERARALPAPEIRVDRGGALGPAPQSAWPTVRAWTLGELAAAVGAALGERVAVTLNGSRVRPDGELALVRGDTVVFRSGAS